MKQNMNIAFIPSSALRLLDFMHSGFFSEKLKGTKKTSCKNGTWLNIDSRWEDEEGFFIAKVHLVSLFTASFGLPSGFSSRENWMLHSSSTLLT